MAELGECVFGERDPAALLTRSRPIRLHKRSGRTVLEIDLPGATKDELEVRRVGSDLLVRVRDAHRRIALPDSVAALALGPVRLEDGVLELSFES